MLFIVRVFLKHTHTQTYICINKHMCFCVCVYTCVCMNGWVRAWVCVYMNVCVHVHDCVNRTQHFKRFYSIVCFPVKSFISRQECPEKHITMYSLQFTENCFRNILMLASSECMCAYLCLRVYPWAYFFFLLFRFSQLILLWGHI